MANNHSAQPFQEWKPIKGYERFYEISNTGSVRALPRVSHFFREGRPFSRVRTARVLRPIRSNEHGHLKIGLVGDDGEQRFYLMHRLVLEHFVGPCPKGREACHNDGDPTNNCVRNLRWDTHKANQEDMVRHGHTRRGSANPQSVLSENDVIFIRKHCQPRHPLFSRSALAKRFHVSRTAIYLVVRNRNWRTST